MDLVLNIHDDDDDNTDVPLKEKPNKKGGRWTERLKAKRSLKRKRSGVEQAQNSEDAFPRGLKRQKIHGKAEPALPQKSRPQTQIISSLFTSNPVVEAPSKPQTTSAPKTPSNAPLDHSQSLTDLGLDPLLASHLSKKLGITQPTSIQRATLMSAISSTNNSDIFIQSQTGSGKTLAFLLPIVQDLLPLSSLSYIDRSIGTLAIIIAPTRELAKQISDVLESILSLRLRPEDENPDCSDHSQRLTRWLVSGLLIGGATRTHEKARLRKGIPILVSTPGRLLDHLQHTSSFQVSKCRWLVLDEADRLMEMGFEDTINGILKSLDGHRRLAIQAEKEGVGQTVGGWDWKLRRRTILCSATIRDDVQKLAGTTLIDPVVIKSMESKAEVTTATENQFATPSQLSQKYIIVPLKLRLVALVALLRTLVSQSRAKSGAKIIVFLSCTDSVDFHWHLLAGTSMDYQEPDDLKKSDDELIERTSPLLPQTSVFHLHGALSTQTRLETISRFVRSQNAAVLLCTSVASRGLDLPYVGAVIQYDLPTEGGATEYVHRVGRTARAGKSGQAWSFVAPHETEWAQWVQKSISQEKSEQSLNLIGISVEDVLRNGFGGKGDEYQERATQVQLAFERWVLEQKSHVEYARSAFLSHIRAYATHPSAEKHIFHVRKLHLGHLAKAFALRDAPKSVTGPQKKHRSKDRKHPDSESESETNDTARRMKEVVRAQGRLTKKGA